ncbi:MAG: ribonuclease III [Clostridiales bacterium]|jgi:ribonuclease-3|nr:ribonuclease III [Clostridiales bacterium]
MTYAELEQKIGYTFRDAALLERALTHSSYANEVNLNLRRGRTRVLHNEMLEFLGDSVLGFTIAEHLFLIRPDDNEGGLSRKRAAIVCERALSGCARALNLGAFMRIGRNMSSQKDRNEDSVLSDAAEALFAAVYLDGGAEAAKRVILAGLADAIAEALSKGLALDSKTRLQELLQDDGRPTQIEYAVVSESGPAHKRRFTSKVTVNGRLMGMGDGGTKKESEQNAAKEALKALETPENISCF